MTRYKLLIDGTKVAYTTEEENKKNLEEQAWIDGALDRALKNLRKKRNKLLSDTDFYANSDVTMSDAMRTYRQKLRDITNGLTTVDEVNAVVFPEKPLE